MSKELSSAELQKLIKNCLDDLSSLMSDLSSDDENKPNKKRAMLLAYWLISYIRMLKSEKSFDSKKLLSYKRGDVVSVDFGYRIGSELGGRHFAVVIDNHNGKNSGILTVIPLKSKKPNYKESRFNFELKVGLHELHRQKFNIVLDECKTNLSELIDKSENPQEDTFDIAANISNVSKRINEARMLKKETENLKDGTVVEVGQIVTISKIRILNPKQSSDSLSKIHLSSDDLDTLNEKIKNLYIYEKKPHSSDNDSLQAFKDGLENNN